MEKLHCGTGYSLAISCISLTSNSLIRLGKYVFLPIFTLSNLDIKAFISLLDGRDVHGG